MKERLSANLRKWLSLLTAIAGYYLIHEGAHALVALCFGTFRGIRILGPGVQVMADTAAMSPARVFLFSMAGAAVSLAAAYILVLLTGRIARLRPKFPRALGYYGTLVLLLVDPIYLSMLCGLFGGGDINGVAALGVSTLPARILFGAVGLFNLWLIAGRVYPAYKRSFAGDAAS